MKAFRFAVPAAFVLSGLLLVACEQDRINNIPTTATLATSGNQNLSYTAPFDGTVWVYDVPDDRLDYSGPLMANQAIVVNPQTNQIIVDGRVVSDKKLNQMAEHRIYYQQGTQTRVVAPQQQVPQQQVAPQQVVPQQ
jgi:hypothetical protein